jgi:hypothetical protein
MRIPLALVASLIITFGVLGVLDWNMVEIERTPQGEVTVTQLPHESDPALLAQVEARDQAAVASNL